MDITLKQLEALVWVADLGSFRRAAERLNTTQPNISTRIATLENQLGVTLMERDAGSVRLTVKGAELLGHARKVLGASENLIAATGDPGLLSGTLRLGVTEMIVHTWLHQFLNMLKQRFVNLVVELTVDMSVILEAALVDRSIDLALQNGPFERISSGEIDLGVYPSTWAASPELGLADDAVAFEDLAAHPILTHARDTRYFREVSEHFRTAARIVPSSNLAACQHMALNGMGIALLPEAMIAKELRDATLVPVAYGWRPNDMQFYARWDRERAASVVAAAAALAAEVSADFLRASGEFK
ncbi:MAG: LysR family transcriptional regulator [Pseudomonadota bacterium]